MALSVVLIVVLAADCTPSAKTVEALKTAAICFEEQRDYAAALKLYQLIADEFPASAEGASALFRVGLDAEQSYDFEKAVKTYRLFLSRYPNSPNAENAAFNVARLLAAENRSSEAAEASIAFAKQFPDSEEATRSLLRAVDLFEREGANEREISTIRECLKLGSGKLHPMLVVDLKRRLGLALRRLGQRAEAERTFNAAADEYDQLEADVDDQIFGAESAAQSRFELAELQFSDFLAMKLRSKNSKQFAEDLAGLQDAATRLQSAYDAVIPYRRAEWTLAAFYKKGAVLEVLAERMRNMVLPPGAADRALDEQAIKFFEDVIVEAKKEKLSLDWMWRCQDDLRRLSPGSALAKAGPMPVFVTVGLPAAMLEGGERIARRKLDFNPRDNDAIDELANIALVRQQLDLAALLLAKGLEASPGNARFHFVQGQVNLAASRNASAADSFKRACELDPKNAEAASNYGALLLDQGDRTQALSVLQRAVTTAPKLAAAHVNLGNAWRASGDFSKARDEYRLATELAADRPEPWFDLGIMLVDESIEGMTEADRLREALTAFKKLDVLGPKNVVAREYVRIAERRLAQH